MGIQSKSKGLLKQSSRFALGLSFFAFSSTALAQSTPTELADMTLEDLLNFEISDTGQSEGTLPNRWSFSYTYRHLDTGGYRSGTTDHTFDDVLFSPGEVRTQTNFPVVPTFICQKVHGFSGSYRINEKFSVNVALPYIAQGTEHISSVPGFSDFTLMSEGIGDIGISGSYEKRLSDHAAAHFTLGMRLPTGSIEQEGDTPRRGPGTLELLPYTMQLGSGTFDFTGAAGYSRRLDDFKVGLNANATLRTGKNSHDYRLGNNIGAASWVQLTKNKWIQPGLKLSLRHISAIQGQDAGLLVPKPFPYPASITNPNNYGGTKAHISATLKVCLKSDCAFSLSGEYGKPIYQNLNGVQPKDLEHMSLSASANF